MARRRLKRVIAQAGELAVERDPDRPGGRLLRQQGMEASYVDLADPRHLEFDYLRWIRLVLRASRAHRVLHVGGGACTLARALALERPDGRQHVCEIDANVIAFAREHLGLRRTPGLRVRHAEGRRLIADQPDGCWEAIVIDAFVGAAVPRHLVTVEALCDCARVAPLTLVNVVDEPGRDVRLIAAGLAAAYPRVWRLSGRGENSVLVGTTLSLPLGRIAAAAAADPSPARLHAPAECMRATARELPLLDAELRGALTGW